MMGVVPSMIGASLGECVVDTSILRTRIDEWYLRKGGSRVQSPVGRRRLETSDDTPALLISARYDPESEEIYDLERLVGSHGGSTPAIPKRVAGSNTGVDHTSATA